MLLAQILHTACFNFFFKTHLRRKLIICIEQYVTKLMQFINMH